MRIPEYVVQWIEGYPSLTVHRFDVTSEQEVGFTESYSKDVSIANYGRQKYTVLLQVSGDEKNRLPITEEMTVIRTIYYKDGKSETEQHVLKDCYLEQQTFVSKSGSDRFNYNIEAKDYTIKKYIFKHSYQKTREILADFRSSLRELFPHSEEREKLLKEECVKLGGHKFPTSKIINRNRCELCSCDIDNGSIDIG
jgi:hypothetical protein